MLPQKATSFLRRKDAFLKERFFLGSSRYKVQCGCFSSSNWFSHNCPFSCMLKMSQIRVTGSCITEESNQNNFTAFEKVFGWKPNFYKVRPLPIYWKWNKHSLLYGLSAGPSFKMDFLFWWFAGGVCLKDGLQTTRGCWLLFLTHFLNFSL